MVFEPNRFRKLIIVVALLCTPGLGQDTDAPQVTTTNAPTNDGTSISSSTTLPPSTDSTFVTTGDGTTSPTSLPSAGRTATSTGTPSNPSITDQPSPGPNSSTVMPSDAATLSPVSVVIPTLPPSDITSNVPTPKIATPMPSFQPTIVTFDPTEAPTGPPPTSRPSNEPTKEKTDKPTKSPTQQPISSEPTTKPTFSGTSIESTVDGVTVTFTGVGELSTDDIVSYRTTTKQWFDEFFNGIPNDERALSLYQRKLQTFDNNRQLQTSSIRGMDSTVIFGGQTVSADSVRIVYSQTLRYIALDGAAEPSALVLEPYEDVDANADLAARLRKAIDTFDGVEAPIDIPEIVPEEEQEVDDGGLSLGVIIGIAAGGAALCCIVLYASTRFMNRDKDGAGYVDTGSLPPSQFNINAAEDISTMDDPTINKVASGDMSVGQYGDQSVATVDYDYSKAYGGGGDTSVVSSVGGTLGDNTRQTSGDIVANSARAALGASFEADVQNEFKEEIIVIDAPAGKLGVVIDTPDDGAPVVHAVKDSSVIADQIRVGDKLIAVDEDDVRSMTAIKVSKLISKKSANPSRKLTIVRMSHVDHP